MRVQFRRFATLSLLLLAIVSFGCKKNTPAAAAPAPPPPPPPAPSPTITVRAEPATIDRGQSTTLTWEARNASAVRIEPGLGEVTTAGNRQVSPDASITYNFTAVGPGGTAQETVRVTVNVPPPAPKADVAPPRAADPSIEELFRKNIQTVYFDYDQADIRSSEIGKLQGNAAWLKANPGVRVRLEGHADERGSQEYNLALGERRAAAVKQFLVTQGVAENRLSVTTLGEERPECKDQTEECYQRNRKAAFAMNK